MKIKEKTKNKIIFIPMLVLIAICIIYFGFHSKKAEIDTSYIIAKLEKSSELTTAKLKYTGMSEYKDEGVTFINKSDFVMVYEATARAGIDVKVNMDSIKYFDEKFALLNVDYKEDANRATSLAEKEAVTELEDMGILKMADEQAEALIKGLIQDVIPRNYKIQIKSTR